MTAEGSAALTACAVAAALATAPAAGADTAVAPITRDEDAIFLRLVEGIPGVIITDPAIAL